MALTLGAPVIEPIGKLAAIMSQLLTPSLTQPQRYDHLIDILKSIGAKELTHFYRALLCRRQIVSYQIDNHHVFRALLVTFHECRLSRLVVRIRISICALNGLRTNSIAFPFDVSFRGYREVRGPSS